MEHDSEMQGGSTMPDPMVRILATLGYIESRWFLRKELPIGELVKQATVYAANFVNSDRVIRLHDPRLHFTYDDGNAAVAWSRLHLLYHGLLRRSKVKPEQKATEAIDDARVAVERSLHLAEGDYERAIANNLIMQLKHVVDDDLTVLYKHSLERIVMNRRDDLVGKTLTRHAGSTPGTYRYRDYVITAVAVEEAELSSPALITFTVVDEHGYEQELCFYELEAHSGVEEEDDIWFENVDGVSWSIYSTPLREEFCQPTSVA